MEIGLGPGGIVLDGDQAHPMEKGIAAPTVAIYGPISIVAKRLDGSRCHLVRK